MLEVSGFGEYQDIVLEMVNKYCLYNLQVFNISRIFIFDELVSKYKLKKEEAQMLMSEVQSALSNKLKEA